MCIRLILNSRNNEKYTKELLNIKNKEVAHSDAEITEISIKLYSDGNGAIYRNIRAPFQLHTLKSILSIIEKTLDSRCSELRNELPLNVCL